MIASLRGLAILAAIAVILAVVARAGAPATVTLDHTLVGSFDLSRVTSIRFRHEGQPDVQIARKPDGRTWENADHTPVDPATIDALFTALRGARWQRQEVARVAWPYRGDLRLESDRGALVLAQGRTLDETGQTWIHIGASDRVLLVDSWVAHALFPAPLELRIRHPFAGAAAATKITSKPIELVGTRLIAPRGLWVDPSVVGQLTSALAALELVAVPAEVPPAAVRELSYDGPQANTLALVGSCPDHQVLLRATTGPGCYDDAAWHAVDLVLTALDAASDELSDRRPLPIAPASLTFGTGPTLMLGSPPRLGDTDADPSRIAELLTALTTAGELVPRPPGAPTSSLTARDAAGTEVILDVFAPAKLVARRGEAIAIRPRPESWAILMRPASALRDPIRWREDATTIRSITVGQATYTRGAVLGEWTRTPAGSAAPDGALVDALASALATVRAPDAPDDRQPTPLAVEVTFAPPAGTPTTHELRLGAPTAGGCAAVIDGVRVRAEPALCIAAHAL